jgi:hypothetical protein
VTANRLAVIPGWLARLKKPNKQKGKNMSTKKPILGTSYGNILQLGLNLELKLPKYKVTLGITDTQITELGTFNNHAKTANDWVTQITKSKEDFTAYRKELYFGPEIQIQAPVDFTIGVASATGRPGGYVHFLAALIKHIKAQPKYTEAIGEELGIIGVDVTHDLDNDRPDLRVEVRAASVHIGIPHKKHYPGGNLYVNRGTGENFHLLAYVDRLEFEDPHQFPETQQTWTYYFAYVLHGKEVGQPSAQVSVAVKRQIV